MAGDPARSHPGNMNSTTLLACDLAAFLTME